MSQLPVHNEAHKTFNKAFSQAFKASGTREDEKITKKNEKRWMECRKKMLKCVHTSRQTSRPTSSETSHLPHANDDTSGGGGDDGTGKHPEVDCDVEPDGTDKYPKVDCGVEPGGTGKKARSMEEVRRQYERIKHAREQHRLHMRMLRNESASPWTNVDYWRHYHSTVDQFHEHIQP
jgi:hypothetical protein